MSKAAEKAYDRINNEGGEGYNPIRTARQDAEAAEAANEQRDPVRQAEHEMLVAKGAYGHGSEEHEAASARYYALGSEREERRAGAFAAEWTRETTVARRTAWNAAAANAKTATEVVECVGFGPDDLRRAIALHNL